METTAVPNVRACTRWKGVHCGYVIIIYFYRIVGDRKGNKKSAGPRGGYGQCGARWRLLRFSVLRDLTVPRSFGWTGNGSSVGQFLCVFFGARTEPGKRPDTSRRRRVRSIRTLLNRCTTIPAKNIILRTSIGSYAVKPVIESATTYKMFAYDLIIRIRFVFSQLNFDRHSLLTFTVSFRFKIPILSSYLEKNHCPPLDIGPSR